VFGVLVHWLLSALLFLTLSKLPIGVRVDGLGSALLAALIFGALNTFFKPVLQILTLPITLLTLGLFLFVVNALVFWLAAILVPGFRLTHGFWSALMGSTCLVVLQWLVQLLFLKKPL
jgi:putative membrane protein